MERQLAANPDDADAWALKRILYSNLTEADYQAAAGDGVAADFDHGYAQQLGLALINDPVRWQRGGEYLRLAARGMPALGPSLFTQIAQAHERAGHAEGALHNFELAKPLVYVGFDNIRVIAIIISIVLVGWAIWQSKRELPEIAEIPESSVTAA